MQPGSVPYGRIINNTMVGLGGRLESNNLYTEHDYQDVGILIEDNADPTLINNVIVNFQEGIVTDLSSTRVVLGGTLFQGNRTRVTSIRAISLIVPPMSRCSSTVNGAISIPRPALRRSTVRSIR